MRKAKQNELKRRSALAALDWVEENLLTESEDTFVGIGSGSTISFAFERMADWQVTAVPTSLKTRQRLKELGMEVEDIKKADLLQFDIDGADEVDPNLNLIKGGGGAHYKEKRVALKSKKLIIVVDETKLVDFLGQKFPLPVEILPQKRDSALTELRSLKLGSVALRSEGGNGEYFRTDNGNLIADIQLNGKWDEDQLRQLEEEINRIDGVWENGFFVKRPADMVFVGREKRVELLKKGNSSIDLPATR